MRRSLHRGPIQIRVASARDRESIYRLRHEVYASELKQHAENNDSRLIDPLDAYNVNIVASVGGQLAGFVSITPPDADSFSIDKYFSRRATGLAFDPGLYEIRLLTVSKEFRHTPIATLLMHAALRWVDSSGGTNVVAIGRRDLLDLYRKVGFASRGLEARSGAVTYELMTASIGSLRDRAAWFEPLVRRVEDQLDWQLGIPLHRSFGCFHGGASFDAIGNSFERLGERDDIESADVLDAWFPPSPKVVRALENHSSWIARTSPPVMAEGMRDTIARARNVPAECILPGAGSSSLIYLTLCKWLDSSSRVLVLDPSYGEYAHVFENVVQCEMERLRLSPHDWYEVDLTRLADCLSEDYDLVVLVNPNNPTGRHVPRRRLEAVLTAVPPRTRVWIDETYIEYAGSDESLETFAAGSESVVVCKSMSKVYALSGLRAAYLCGPRHVIEELERQTPPWSLSLPAQIAAVMALQDREYYTRRYEETHELRFELVRQLRSVCGLETGPSVANFVLCQLARDAPDAGLVVANCREHGVFLRELRHMGSGIGTRMFRVAVKNRRSNQRIVEVLHRCLADQAAGRRSL